VQIVGQIRKIEKIWIFANRSKARDDLDRRKTVELVKSRDIEDKDNRRCFGL